MSKIPAGIPRTMPNMAPTDNPGTLDSKCDDPPPCGLLVEVERYVEEVEMVVAKVGKAVISRF
jgi:hypothetical protein